MFTEFKPNDVLYIKTNRSYGDIICIYKSFAIASNSVRSYVDFYVNDSDICFATSSETDICCQYADIADVRKATKEEKLLLYNALVKAFKDYDLDWDKHFTDSSYFDIFDWLCGEFDINIESLDPRNPSPIEYTINEIQKYIWDELCRETGNYQACTDYVEPEMVNKQEFIAKLKTWLKINTNWDMEYDEEGRNDNYGKIDELVNYLEE